jgi:hypothetical protein
MIGAGDIAPPILVIEIPVHGLLEPAFERHGAALVDLVRELAGIDRIAPIMSRPVSDKADECAAG